MPDGHMVHVRRRVIVDDHFTTVASLQLFLALSARGQISQRCFTKLQPTSVEAIGTIDIDGTPDVVDIVCDERSTIDNEEVA